MSSGDDAGAPTDTNSAIGIIHKVIKIMQLGGSTKQLLSELVSSLDAADDEVSARLNLDEAIYLLEHVSESDIKEDDQCRICLEHLIFGQLKFSIRNALANCISANTSKVLVLPCSARHKFHFDCIKLWFLCHGTMTCPLDRTLIKFR